METNWDCIVVGGGAAGLSAALVLGRARQRTLLVDAGKQSNRVAEGIGGMLGQDARPPADFYAAGRAELAAYPAVEARSGTVTSGTRDGSDFVLGLDDGSRVEAPAVLLAGGMDYRYPDLPGAAAKWGRSVFHCPFCHGWEVREKPLAVLGNDPMAAKRAAMLRSWSDRVALLSDGPAELDADDLARLRERDIEIDERGIAELRGAGADLAAVAFEDGTERACGGLLVPITLHQRSDLALRLGATYAAPTHLGAEAIEVDTTMRAAVGGLYAAGDVLDRPPSVAAAVASGSMAASMIVAANSGLFA